MLLTSWKELLSLYSKRKYFEKLVNLKYWAAAAVRFWSVLSKIVDWICSLFNWIRRCLLLLLLLPPSSAAAGKTQQDKTLIRGEAGRQAAAGAASASVNLNNFHDWENSIWPTKAPPRIFMFLEKLSFPYFKINLLAKLQKRLKKKYCF